MSMNTSQTTQQAQQDKAFSDYLNMRRFVAQQVASVHGVLTGADVSQLDELEAQMTPEQILKVERIIWG